MSEEQGSAVHAFRKVPRTGVIYVTTEAAAARLPPRRPGLVQPRPGAARDRPAARARRRACTPCRSRSTTRSTRRCRASGSCARPIAGLYNRLYRRGMPSQYTAENVAVSRRRPHRAHARRRRPRARSTSATSCPTTPPTRSCSTSSRLFTPSPSCSRASAATPSPPTTCGARSPGRGLSRPAALEPVQPDRQARAGRGAAPLGRASARELDCTLLLDEFYSHYVWTGAPGAPAGGERGALRRGRRPGSGRDLRRPDQELALPGLARHLDGRARAR